MSITEKFWGSVGIIFLVIVNYYAMSWFQKSEYASTTSNYCGTVQSTNTKETAVKHGTRTDFYVIVDFDEIGTKAIETDPTTYYTAVSGQKICFQLTNRFVKGNVDITSFEVLCGILAAIGDFLLLILLGLFIVDLINRGLSFFEK